MSFLLFAFRKLSLKRQINNKNFQLTMLSTNLERIQSQMSVMQQASAGMQDAWSMLSNQLMSAPRATLGAESSGYSQQLNDFRKQYTDAIAKGDESGAANIKAQIDAMQDKQKTALMTGFMANQAFQMGMVEANQLVNSVFGEADKAKMAQLQAEDQRYDQQKESLESQLTLLNAEYESVKKAEQESAKNTATNFGLG